MADSSGTMRKRHLEGQNQPSDDDDDDDDDLAKYAQPTRVA
jgi:hypothetical protein